VAAKLLNVIMKSLPTVGADSKGVRSQANPNTQWAAERRGREPSWRQIILNSVELANSAWSQPRARS
jgi:hypothetical protein